MKNNNKTREQQLTSIEQQLQTANQQLRESEKELKKEKQFSENLLDIANVFILNLDTNANIILFNKFAEKLTGYKKEEVLGKNWFDIFISKSDESAILDVFSNVLKEMPEFSSYENAILCKSGSERMISWQNTVLKDNNKKISGMLSIGTDITERKQADEELSIKNEVFNASITANSTSDNEGFLTYVNETFIEVFGYKNFKETIGKPISDFLKFEDEAINIIKLLNETGKWEGEYTGLRKDGTTFFAHGLATIIKDYQGNRIGYQSVVQDITESKQTEETLRIERDNMKSIFEAMEDGIYLTNQHFDIQYVNPILKKDFGNYKDKKCYEYFHDRTKVCPWCKNLEVFAGKTVRWEWFSSKTGKTYDLIDTPLKNPDGSLSKLEIFRDITERKQAEEVLKSSEERLTILFESAPDAYYLSDLKGVFIDGNKAAEDLMGYKKEELIGKSFLKRGILSKKELLKASKLLLKNIQGKSTGPDEFILNRQDGCQVSVEIRTHPVKIKNKTVILGIAHDITQRKQIEREIYQKTEDLALLSLLNNAVNKGKNLQEIKQLLTVETKRVFSSYGITLYLLSEDKKYLEMQNHTLPSKTIKQIEKLIGMKIPAIRIPLNKESWYLKTLQAGETKQINDPGIIQGMMAEFTKSMILKKLIPKIYKILDITSVINGPLISRGKTIGLLDISRQEPFSASELQRFKLIVEELTILIEHIRAGEALKESEEKYRLLATNALDTIWTMDLEYNITFVNNAIYNFLGYTPEEFLGINPAKFTTQEGLKTIQNIAEQLIVNYKEGEIAQSRFELQQIRKNGTMIDVEISSNVLLNSEGKLIGFQGRSVDITKQKQTEENIRKRNEELELFNKMTVSRELKMIELKKEINSLLEKAEESPKYKIVD